MGAVGGDHDEGVVDLENELGLDFAFAWDGVGWFQAGWDVVQVDDGASCGVGEGNGFLIVEAENGLLFFEGSVGEVVDFDVAIVVACVDKGDGVFGDGAVVLCVDAGDEEFGAEGLGWGRDGSNVVSEFVDGSDAHEPVGLWEEAVRDTEVGFLNNP